MQWTTVVNGRLQIRGPVSGFFRRLSLNISKTSLRDIFNPAAAIEGAVTTKPPPSKQPQRRQVEDSAQMKEFKRWLVEVSSNLLDPEARFPIPDT